MEPAVLALFVPIFGILGGVAIAVLAILARHRQRMQRTELRHRERLAAIERGLELPPDPPEADPHGTDSRFLRLGLVLVAIGATVTAALGQIPGNDVPFLFGLIPAAVGVAYLLYYAIRSRQAARVAPKASTPDAT